MKLDLLTLKLFVRVLEEGTISQAAEREHIAAAAVSRRIADLEQSLHTTLLVRTNKGVSPTAAGLELLYRSRALLNSAQDIESHLLAYSQGQQGLVHILANTSAISQFLPTPLGLFGRQHPGIHLQLEEKTSLDIIRALAEGKADLGVFTRLPYDADIQAYPFRSDKLVVLVPNDHPLACHERLRFEQTLEHEQITLLPGTQINYQITKVAMEANRSVRVRTEVSGYDAMCLLVNAGMGIAILPRESAHIYHVPNTRMLELDEDWSQRELLIGVRRHRELQPSAQTLLNFLLGSPA
ncbi:MAG TPA: LysR substrate-binding domain-containing protein [Alcaligenes sp.]|nr:LysR substrate-binding domain-containing protein [Alcaligenes sp.]